MLEMESPPGGTSTNFVWKYCRMCALEVKQGVYIFGEEGRRLQIPEKIRKTVATLVLEEDSLPKKICTSCCTRLESFAQFKDTVVDAQEKLASIARSIEKSQEQNLLQFRNRHQVSPKRLRLYSSHHGGNHSNSHALLPAPSIAVAEPVMDDPAIECDDDQEPPSSVVSSEGDENETPKCFSSVETGGREEEPNNQEPVQGSSQGLLALTKQPTQGQVQHADQMDTSANNSSPDNSPAAYSEDGDTECQNPETEAYLICGLCTAHLNDKHSLAAHHDKHHGGEEDPMFGCSACPRITSSYEAIRQHIYRHRMDGTFKCTDCEKSYPTKDQLHVHISSKHNPAGSKAFSCSTCGKNYSSNFALTAHQRKKHKPDFCQGSPAATDQNERSPQKSNSSVLESPPRSTAASTPAVTPAPSSENLFKNPSPSNKNHSPVSGDNKAEITKANVTESNTGSSDSLSSESQATVSPSQQNSIKESQNVGSRSCSSSSDISKKREEPESDEGHWKCEHCDKILYSKSGYDTHIKVHRGKRYACEDCGASYTQKVTLEHHIKVHHANIDKEFECSECKKQFKTFRQLQGHQKIHDKPLTNVSCPLCEKKLLNMVSLKTHMKYHRGSKKFPCSLCPKSFFTRLKLQEHMNSHTGKRPFGCPLETCSKVFSCSTNYVKHFKKHHADLVGPRGKMVPQPKMVEDNNNTQITTKSSPNSNGTVQTSSSRSSSAPTDNTMLPQSTDKNQQPLSHSSFSHGRSQDFSQQSCPSSPGLLSESPVHSSHPTTVIQVPYPTNLSTTGIPQRSVSQFTSTSNSFSNGVLTSSVNSIQQHPSNLITSSSGTSSVLHVTSHPNLPFVGNGSSSGSHVITLHSSNIPSGDSNMSIAHSQSSMSSGTSSQAHSQHSGSIQGAHMSTPSTISTHTQTGGAQSQHSMNQLQLQPHTQTQSVWQPVMLPSSKTYNHPNSTVGLATINGLDLLDCAGVIVAAHSSESLPTSSSNNHPHGQHQQGNFNVIHMPVTAAHHSNLSHSTASHVHHHGANLSTSGNSGHSNVHQGGISHHSSSSLHIPNPTPSAHNSIPLSNAGTVTVPNFIPSSQQNEPMELSYKLESNNFQDMPMELTKVFQRDPLELCVRQDFAGGAQPLMDLSSRVVNVSVGGNPSSINVSSINLHGNNTSTNSQHHYGSSSGSGTNTTTVLSVPYHKSELMERELSLNDFTGAFRQPIDLIARSDEHSHELCSEGNLVDLSLRSSFGQDQTASSFLRELIDLSSRSDSFHGEINLTNKQQQHPQQASNAHSQPPLNHHPHSSAGQHPTSRSGNQTISHHNHHGSHHGNPHNHHHHIQQAPSHHHQSSSNNGPGAVAMQNVIYPDAIFNLQN